MKSLLGIFVCTSLILSSGCGKKKKPSKDMGKELALNDQATDAKGEEYLFDENIKPIEDLAFLEEDRVDTAPATFVSEAEADNKDFVPVKFGFDSDRMLPGQNDSLKKDVELAQKTIESGEKVVVEGYACQIGDAPYNMALTQRRASNIKKQFVNAGLSIDKIEAVGRGQENPIVWSDAQNRATRIKELAPNRRVELHSFKA